MRIIKKFEEFTYGGAGAPAPSRRESPTITPSRPGVDPRTKPGKPSPIRRDRPAVEPAPKAGKGEMETATMDDVINKFARLTNQKYE